MHHIEGRIFVWTYKGDVYIRKDASGAPRLQINSEDDLKSLMEGKTSLTKENLAPVIVNENAKEVVSAENV